MKKKRVFTAEQKMEILREVEQNGMVATCRKYDIAQSLYYQWKRKFDQQGIDGLQGHYNRMNPQMKELEKENERFFHSASYLIQGRA
ncbi:MAG TPA: transposase [Bacteroidales bacterium]|nr:transposase [Bacteroidales bacterium]